MAKTNTTQVLTDSYSGAICVSFRANSRVDFKLKTHSTVGFIKHELIFTAYCRDNLFRWRYNSQLFVTPSEHAINIEAEYQVQQPAHFNELTSLDWKNYLAYLREYFM